MIHPDHVRHVNVSHADNFSLLETHVIVAMLVPRFQLRLKPGFQPQVAMEGTSASKNGMPMIVQERL